MSGRPKPSVLLLAVLAAAGRFLPHPPNFTPVGSAALFGGARLGRPWNYILPMLIMFVTDLFLGFHATIPYVYVSFLIAVFLGEKFLTRPTAGRVVGVSLVSSVIFFIISNFGVWISGGLYPQTVDGLIRCFVMALPFFQWTVAGDVIYSLGFFGLYALAENRGVAGKFDSQVTARLGYKQQ